MHQPSTSVRRVRTLLAVATAAAAGVAAPAAAAASDGTSLGATTLRLAAPEVKPAIVNGDRISVEQVPWQVFVTARVAAGDAACGGSIYDADTVVTAAHCVFDATTRLPVAPGDMTVAAGISNFRTPEATAQVVGVSAIVVHPYYDYGASGVAPDDVALLQLDRSLDLSGPAVRPIALTTSGPQPAPGTAGHISGFGRQVPGGTPDGQLYGVATTLGDPLACGGDATAVVLCIQSQTGSACEGDSGGPLTVAATLAGVASFVTLNGPTGECGIGSVNGYVNVAAPEIAQFIAGDPAPPRAPRGGRDISARGVLQVGRSITCSPGTWSEAPTFVYTFTDTRTGTVLQSGPSATYAFGPGDAGRTVDCRVAAANAGGTGVARTEASPPIAPDPTPPPPRPRPTPPPAPAPQPRPQPRPRRPAVRRPDVGVRVTAASARARSGATVRSTIRVVNRGRAAARRVIVCSAPSRGLAFGALPRGARKARGRACWRVGTLRARSSRTLRLTLRIARTSRTRTVTNRVRVDGANIAARRDRVRIRVRGVQRRTAPPAVTG